MLLQMQLAPAVSARISRGHLWAVAHACPMLFEWQHLCNFNGLVRREESSLGLALSCGSCHMSPTPYI